MPELLIIILSPVMVAALIYFLPEKSIRPVAVFLQLFIIALAVQVFIQVQAENRIVINIGSWPESVGIALTADRLSAVMIMLMSVLFVLFLLFDLDQVRISRSFMTLFLFLEGLLAGIFVAGDFFNVYVLLEVATIIVTLLILFDVEKRSIYDGIFYIMINMTAMTMYLFGLGLLYRMTGTLSMIILPKLLESGYDSKSAILPFAFMASAVSLKAALFPLFSWLPKAHGSPGAPSSVSALLSGLYVKTGLLLLFRLITIFKLPGSETFFMIVGGLTAFAGIIFALLQTDIKKLLGYSTISQIGLILAAFSYGSVNSRIGAMMHILNHALFKSALFLAAGVIVERYGTRDIRKIRDVSRRLPWISTAMFLGMLGVTGAPFFNGSVSKYLIKADFTDITLKIILLIINLGTVLYFLRLSQIFRKVPNLSKDSKEFETSAYGSVDVVSHAQINKAETNTLKRAIVLLLGALCLLTGVMGGFISGLLFDHNLHITGEILLDNSFSWIFTMAAGLLFYRLFARPLRSLQKLNEFEPGFNHVSIGMGLYFGTIIISLLAAAN